MVRKESGVRSQNPVGIEHREIQPFGKLRTGWQLTGGSKQRRKLGTMNEALGTLMIWDCGMGIFYCRMTVVDCGPLKSAIRNWEPARRVGVRKTNQKSEM
jgi:hypothetical protein